MIRRRAALIAGVVACLALSGCSGSDENNGDDHSHTHETGSDDHAHIDPVASDPAITAKFVAMGRYSWTPGVQDNVWDMPERLVSESLTGEAKDKADDPGESAAKDTPNEWQSWASLGATVRAIVTDPVVEGVGDQRTVTVTVRQDLEYPDGSATTWKTSTIQIHLVSEDDRWKADTIKEK